MKYPTKAEVEQRAQTEAFAAAKEKGLQEIYRAFEIIPRNEGNDKGIDEICTAFLLGPEAPTGQVAPDLPTFRSAVEEKPDILKGKFRVFIEAVARQKLRILEDIEQLLTGKMSPFDLASELKKLSFWTVPQLQARRQQIIERQRLSKLSTTAIKQELDAGRPKPNRYHPFDLLDPALTATELKAILKSHKANFYMQKFGSVQLNDRLFGRG